MQVPEHDDLHGLLLTEPSVPQYLAVGLFGHYMYWKRVAIAIAVVGVAVTEGGGARALVGKSMGELRVGVRLRGGIKTSW